MSNERAAPTRRLLLATGLLAWPLTVDAAQAPAAVARVAELEKRSGGRIGLAVLDTGDGRRLGYKADERFPMCSTFKVLAASAVLTRADKGQERLDRRVVFQKSDLVPNSPITESHVGGGGMTLAELAEAAITVSDNTAGNLLLKAIGGPPGLTAFARTLGDRATRMDRWETELNEAKPGDLRDTTKPAAMLENLRRLLMGDALSLASRAQLAAWLAANKTGASRLKAGLPADWRIGDKTGSGENGATNDIGILKPPGQAPLLVCAYTTGSPAPAADRNAVLAELGRVVADWT